MDEFDGFVGMIGSLESESESELLNLALIELDTEFETHWLTGFRNSVYNQSARFIRTVDVERFGKFIL